MLTPDHEPRNGDFVAYLAELERRQMQSVQVSHTFGPPPAQAHDKAAKRARANVEQIFAAGKATPALGVAIGTGLIGLVLVLIGLALDGGWIFLLIGAFLVWRAYKMLLKLGATLPGPAQQVDHVFGRSGKAKSKP